MTRFRCFRALVLTTVFAALGFPAHAATIENLLPFTGLDNVKVLVALSGKDASGDVELTGRIFAVGNDKSPQLWEGSLGTTKLAAGASSEFEHNVADLKPKLWTPATPNLYTLTVEARQSGKTLETKSVRFGFRMFEAKDGHLLLNGKPVFVRGIAINPPDRGLDHAVSTSRKFVEDYVRFMRAHNVNMIRLNGDSQTWFDVCDELGMMIYNGVYGSPAGGKDVAANKGKKKIPDVDAGVAHYREIFDTYVAHPSVCIYILSNELPYEGEIGQGWHEFLTAAHAKLKTRYTVPFIGNAGYGQGREGDINDVHRYWGWYYNSLLTFYNLRDPLLFGDPAKSKTQPLTFSECVGSFTGPSGAFNLIFRKQLGAQLHWTGHAEDQVREAQEYQAFIFKHAAEEFRTMRPINPRLSGLMPFTIVFRNWVGVKSFDQMGHNANADQMVASYRPVLLSWENWTPNVYAGTKLSATAHVVNDAEDFSDLSGASLAFELRDSSGKAVPGSTGSIELATVPYYATSRSKVEIDLSPALPTGKYVVHGVITKTTGQVSENTFDVFIAGADWKTGGAKVPDRFVRLFDPTVKTAAAFSQLGIRAEPTDLGVIPDDGAPIVIGEGAWKKGFGAGKGLAHLAKRGRRILVLRQDRETFDASWLPSAIEFPRTSLNDPTYEKRERPTFDGMHVNPERPWHPVLLGVSRDDLKLWSDYTNWDQFKPGFPAIYPVTSGFRLTNAKDLSHTAIIANYDRGLEAIAVAEMFDGKGSVTMTSFELVPRAGRDPVADRVLKNLVAYVTGAEGHEVQPLVEQPIVWGNYPTERGVVVEPLGGLAINCRWQKPPTAPDAKPLPDNEGAWNTRPGDGFLPHGRRVLGPWTYTNATGIRELNEKGKVISTVTTDAAVPGEKTTERDDADNALRKTKNVAPGHGEFWARIPSGKSACVTKLENTGDRPAKIEMSVNGGKPGTVEIAPKASGEVKCEIPAGAADVNVRFVADKNLVLLETSFD
jgi:hypothetical protein